MVFFSVTHTKVIVAKMFELLNENLLQEFWIEDEKIGREHHEETDERRFSFVVTVKIFWFMTSRRCLD